MLEFDQSLFHSLFSLGENSYIQTLAVFFGRVLPYFLALLYAGVLWFTFRGARERIFLGIETLLALIVSRGLIAEAFRVFYDNARPFDALNLEALIQTNGLHNSFPSAHATILFTLATLLYFRTPSWGLPFGLFALLVGIARIIVGVHWPSDILGGALVGILAGIIVYRLARPHFKKLQERS